MRDRIQLALEPAVWWILRKLYRTHDVHGLAFLDVRMAEEGAASLIPVLQEALRYIEDAGYRDLVIGEIRFVAAVRHPRDSVSSRVKAYKSPFSGHERGNAFYLACKLVWAASYLRQHRELRAAKAPVNEAAVRQEASEHQLRFLAAVPNSEAWLAYLQRDHARDVN